MCGMCIYCTSQQPAGHIQSYPTQTAADEKKFAELMNSLWLPPSLVVQLNVPSA